MKIPSDYIHAERVHRADGRPWQILYLSSEIFVVRSCFLHHINELVFYPLFHLSRSKVRECNYKKALNVYLFIYDYIRYPLHEYGGLSGACRSRYQQILSSYIYSLPLGISPRHFHHLPFPIRLLLPLFLLSIEAPLSPHPFFR